MNPAAAKQHSSDQAVPQSDRFRLQTFVFGISKTWIAVILLLVTHAALLAYAAMLHSPTTNEPGHLVAGLSNWEFGRFELYRVNPPLTRMIAAIPVMVVGYESDWNDFYERPGARPVFAMGENFVAANGERSIWLFTLARWACIPISLTGGLFCFLWSRELWDSEFAGLVALALWCFDPNILAHGELITPDCAAASLGLGAGYLFWRWLRKPTWSRAVAAGLLLGVAQLTKMTWIVLFGLWPLLWLFWVVTGRRRIADAQFGDSRPPSYLHQTGQLGIVLLLGLCVLNLGYGFDGSCAQLKEFTFVSTALTGEKEPNTSGNRFAGTWMASLPVPLPSQYVIGMDVQKRDLEDYGELSYLRGEWKDGGWWYYYLYGLAVKTPHGTQFLLVLTITVLIIRHRDRRIRVSSVQREDQKNWRDIVIVLTPAITVLVLVSSQLEFNHHIRYVLPIFGFTFVFIGAVGGFSQPTSSIVSVRDE